MSWRDAQAYVKWLGERTGEPYRLPSEAEWEYVARGGTATARHWGDDTLDGDGALGFCEYANGHDLAAAAVAPSPYFPPVDCDDGYAKTAPVGSFKPNGFGLYDVLGNVLEMTEDCWHDNYHGAPTDGRPWVTGFVGCFDGRVVRGGSWGQPASISRASHRGRTQVGDRASSARGFRVARGLIPSSQGSVGVPAG